MAQFPWTVRFFWATAASDQWCCEPSWVPATARLWPDARATNSFLQSCSSAAIPRWVAAIWQSLRLLSSSHVPAPVSWGWAGLLPCKAAHSYTFLLDYRKYSPFTLSPISSAAVSALTRNPVSAILVRPFLLAWLSPPHFSKSNLPSPPPCTSAANAPNFPWDGAASNWAEWIDWRPVAPCCTWWIDRANAL